MPKECAVCKQPAVVAARITRGEQTATAYLCENCARRVGKKMPIEIVGSAIQSLPIGTIISPPTQSQDQNAHVSSQGITNPAVSSSVVKSSKPNKNIAIIGDIGHGKTTLIDAIIKALTLRDGMNNDNPQETTYGSTNIKYAEYETDKNHYTFIDCPGQIEYSKKLFAGNTKIDGVILVVSASEGSTQQTNEYILLAKQHGVHVIVVYMSKTDLIDDEELIELTEMVIRESLSKCGVSNNSVPIIHGSALDVLNSTVTSSSGCVYESIFDLIDTINSCILQYERISSHPSLPNKEKISSSVGEGNPVTFRKEEKTSVLLSDNKANNEKGMTDRQKAIVFEIANNRERYLSVSGPHREDLISLYKDFDVLMNRYVRSLSEHAMNLMGQIKANQEHKVDPFIAGGLASAIGGLGVGLATAGYSAVTNQKIDLYRKYYKQEVFRSGSALSSDERDLLQVAGAIDAILDSTPEIRSMRDSGKIEKYNEAKKLMRKLANGKSRREAMMIFAGLKGYKDSDELYEICKKREEQKYLRYANLWAIGISATMIIIMIIMAIVIGVKGLEAEIGIERAIGYLVLIGLGSYVVTFIVVYLKSQVDPFIDP